ncbi:glycosyltransferase family 4 protein [Maribacter polysiphoniae]|uniref:Glycosyltransferase family 4 protein n=1 Tax=Maribacter polysiphoniae TaxID=429344 RepID=A0A316DUI1_9FLAO|nr:glycosyltransferase family 4 protein [Maribacter polysiphoniae]MBD1262679.1 glycosyltransferase family 4 protein [Maribacter polysiphoniae]PWK21118.1 glycosyltransferase involved in cell wall biosynthesis [Maribacter polysiphoniae]
MKILWITNTVFPDLTKALGLETPVVGGWMYGLAKDLSKSDVNLFVATSTIHLQEYHNKINGIDYYLLKGSKPNTEYDKALVTQWERIIDQINPDLVHIHGTEGAHGLALVKSHPSLKYVISIQGMTSIISRYYTGGIPTNQILLNITFRDFLRRDSILNARNKFKNRGHKVEYEYLKRITNVIGRTQWDHDHVKTINPECQYHFCNESLRDVFYNSPKWSIDTKKDHTIFLSQTNYPLKGLHKVLAAVHLLKNIFPSIKIRIAGNDITRTQSIKDKLRLGGYGKYIKKLIKKYDLMDYIVFTGPLNAEQMVQEYINCHIFICPSSIENSPNSLGEAQFLGTPCIASYVGGVPDMVEHGETGLLYRFEEVEMLAQSIKRLFTNKNLAIKISLGGIRVAERRHDRSVNLETIFKIYQNILSNE